MMMAGVGTSRLSLVALVLFVALAWLTDGATLSGQQNSCSSNSTGCSLTCLQGCGTTCPDNYYPSRLLCEAPPLTTLPAPPLSSSFRMTTPSPTTTTVATTTMTTTKPPQTTTTATTTTVRTTTTTKATTHSPGNTMQDHLPVSTSTNNNHMKARRRRQLPEGTAQQTPQQGTPQQGTPQQGTPQQGTPQQGTPQGTAQGTPQGSAQGSLQETPPPTTTISTTEATTTTPATTTETTTGFHTKVTSGIQSTSSATESHTFPSPAASVTVCRRCSVSSCSLCQDSSQNATVCSRCQNGFSLSSDQKSCTKDSLSAGAIAGIVVGALCFLAIVVVIVVCMLRRFGCPRKNADQFHSRKKEQAATGSGELDGEEYEIGKLGHAPPPPTRSEGYDSLKVTNQDDVQSYSPLEVPHGRTYTNEVPHGRTYTNYRETEDKTRAYTNIPHGNTSETTSAASHQQMIQPDKINEVMSPNSMEVYEPIEVKHSENEEGTYVNMKLLQDQQKHIAASSACCEEVYVDNNLGNVEKVYENT